MESSPLIKAHDHAREASIATHTADTTVAVTEHALAAGEFASAAQTTSSIEALRTLKLLEQHHERLSQLLRYSIDHPTLPQQQQTQQLSDGDSVNEKDGLAPLGDAAMAADAANNTATTGPAATTTTSVSGVVSRGEFAGAAATAKAGATGEYADADPADEGKASSGSPAAASMSAAAAAHRAGAAAMANALHHSHRRYPPSRELSSSIASNLASARGIRSKHRGQPAAPSMSSDQAPGSLEGQVRHESSRAQMQNVLQQTSGQPSWVPPKRPATAPQPQKQQQAPPMLLGTDEDDNDGQEASARSDEGFSRFYNRFGNIINRLSAPLAFAGLPLITEESSLMSETPNTKDATADQTAEAEALKAQQQQQQQHGNPRRTKHLKTASMSSVADPELSKIYSKAALRAIGRDGNSATDSFYVVPKTGHTASYANILSFDQKEKRRMAASIHGGDDDGNDFEDGDDDDFEDAKEVRRDRSPTFSRRSGGGIGGSASSSSAGFGNRMHRTSGKGSQHVVEELYTENQSLKDMLDKLSKRLHAFEASAQHSHMALQESIRFMRPGSPLSATGSAGGGGGGGGGATTIVPGMPGVPGLPSTIPSKAAATTAASGASAGASGGDDSQRKSRDLEDELARALARLEVSEKERLHQEKTLQKYREKWEKLKAGAKARREAQSGPS